MVMVQEEFFIEKPASQEWLDEYKRCGIMSQ